ncbi:transaldolase [Corynebacterium kozikiae]|uniref:transaldolase n=1 Tax=Corynebacterium kozikiae TaxID=2968469 RepID=UPI00211C5A58|nr:transaldolase [Corynebacterium sp. 76QC2CO]MCQ9342820.1 transaldolase [Corynebacterium sp. 76QC2CO]
MNAIDALAAAGTSTWLDDLSRERLNSGNLAEIIESKSIVGVTTNPAIFAAAMSKGDAYDEQIAALREEGATADNAVYAMSIDDVKAAAELFTTIYQDSKGYDGRVSIEVDPRISEDREATLAQARELWERVDRENVMIKIPATPGSLPAITDALAEGISVNVTLIFSVARYREVINAYIEGINRAAQAGLDISKIHSVASFFVSRLDTEVDKRLEEIGTDEALALRGKAGVANARRAYAVFQEFFDSPAAAELPDGANVQRPLWASTGVKNPEYPATLYVTELAGPSTVNTMPEPTIDATLAADNVSGDTLSGTAEESLAIFEQLSAVGIDFEDVFATLEREGVDKFVQAWDELLSSMEQRLS